MRLISHLGNRYTLILAESAVEIFMYEVRLN